MSSSPLSSQEWSGREIAALLAPTLGWEKSEELVSAAAAHLGFPTSNLDKYATTQILELLEQQPGIVGVAARFARMNLSSRRGAGVRVVPSKPPPSRDARDERRPIINDAAPDPPSSRTVPKRVPISELVGLLAATIGQEKSEEVVAMAVRIKRITDDSVNRDQAIALFDLLAESPGIIGVTARFAKVRMMLRFQYG